MRQPLTPSIASSSDLLGLFAILSLDLLLEILYKLPVKSLLMLKCVCKSLNSIISDPKFAKDHLRLSHTRRYHLLMCPYTFYEVRELILFDSRHPSVFDNSATRTTIIPETMLKFPISPFYKGVVIIDSCNGIICFKRMDLNNKRGDLVVWNPCTNKFKIILPPLEILPYNRTSYAIGYDRFIDNYKVVAVSCSHKFCKTKVMIHTLGTNFWRRIQDFPSEIMGVPEGGVGKFVSGTINWMIKDQKNATSWDILSLDLGNESYQEILQPNYGLGEPVRHFRLGVSRDCLCVLAYTQTTSDIWVMKDYGNKDSWTKLFTISFAEVHIYYGSGFVGPHYISEEDDQLFMHFDSKVHVFNNKNSIVKTLNIQGLASSNFTSNVYVESLISP